MKTDVIHLYGEYYLSVDLVDLINKNPSHPFYAFVTCAYCRGPKKSEICEGCGAKENLLDAVYSYGATIKQK